MKITNTAGVYTLTVLETEWYTADEAHRDHIRQKAMLGAEEARCRYVGVFVEPDDLFSEMPKRERVFQHTFPLPIADELWSDLMALREKYAKPGKLSLKEMRAAAASAFE